MARKKKPVNKSPYPDHVIETIARCLWPDIQDFFESEEGQREFAKWKAEQADQEAGDPDKPSGRMPPNKIRDVTGCSGIPDFSFFMLVSWLVLSASE